MTHLGIYLRVDFFQKPKPSDCVKTIEKTSNNFRFQRVGYFVPTSPICMYVMRGREAKCRKTWILNHNCWRGGWSLVVYSIILKARSLLFMALGINQVTYSNRKFCRSVCLSVCRSRFCYFRHFQVSYDDEIWQAYQGPDQIKFEVIVFPI